MSQELDEMDVFRPLPHQPRPTRLFWVQFLLRCIALILSLIAITIAVFVVAKIHKTWVFVFVSATMTLLIDAAEVTALSSHWSLKISLPRVQVFVLIGLDALAIALLVWSFFSLIFDKWGRTHAINNVDYTANPFNGIEMWLALMISGAHVILLIIDFIDCCSRRNASKQPFDDSLPLSRSGSPNRDGGAVEVNDMEWG